MMLVAIRFLVKSKRGPTPSSNIPLLSPRVKGFMRRNGAIFEPERVNVQLLSVCGFQIPCELKLRAFFISRSYI